MLSLRLSMYSSYCIKFSVLVGWTGLNLSRGRNSHRVLSISARNSYNYNQAINLNTCLEQIYHIAFLSFLINVCGKLSCNFTWIDGRLPLIINMKGSVPRALFCNANRLTVLICPATTNSYTGHFAGPLMLKSRR